jgi:uncharacterized protein YkwD
MKFLYFTVVLVSTQFIFGANVDKFERATNLIKSTNTYSQGQTNITNNSSKKITIKEATIKVITSLRQSNQMCAKATTPLVWNQALYTVTKEHTVDMASNNLLSHDGSGKDTDITAKRLGLNRGSHFYERVNQKKDSKKILSGELVVSVSANSYKTPKAVLNYWINRPNDCKVIMDPRFSDVALSKVINIKNGRAYWTLMLAGSNKK